MAEINTCEVEILLTGGAGPSIVPIPSTDPFDGIEWAIKYYIGPINTTPNATASIIAGNLPLYSVPPTSIIIHTNYTLAQVQAAIDADATYIAWQAANPGGSITVTQWTVGVAGIGVLIVIPSLVDLATTASGQLYVGGTPP